MCDRCFHVNRLRPPPINIKELCLDLYKILDYVSLVEDKVTGPMLIDLWYRKGKSNLRCDNVELPKIDRYYAEQIVAYLIAEKYLREDFHFTAYTTISYIKTGVRNAAIEEEIIFHRARVLDLPNIGNSIIIHNTDEPAVATAIAIENTATPARSTENGHQTDDEVMFVSESKLKKKRKSKSSRRSFSGSGSDHDKRKKQRRTTSERLESSSQPRRLLYEESGDNYSGPASSKTNRKSSRLQEVVSVALAKEAVRRKVFAEDKAPTEVCANAIAEDVLVPEEDTEFIEID